MVFFVAGLHYMRPHLMTKKAENMRLRTRVWAQAPKPSSFAELETENGQYFCLAVGTQKFRDDQ